MSVDLDKPLEETDYEALGQILQARAGDHGLLLDALQGLLTAVVIGPEPVPPDEWMPLVLDDGEPFDSVEQAEEAIGLVLRLYNTIATDLETLHWDPILGAVETEGGDITFSAQGWCEGFTLGVDLRAEAWEQRMRDDRALMQKLGPILVLAADEGVYEYEPGEEPTPLSEAEYEDALNKLASSVYDVHQYWRDHPPSAPFTPKPPAADEKPPAVPRRRAGRSVH